MDSHGNQPITGSVQRARGDVFDISKSPKDVTVPFPLRISQVMGPYTERDRKLYAFLLHAAHEKLTTQKTHVVSIEEVERLFEGLGRGKDRGWLWISAKNLSGTVIEWITKNEDGETVKHATPLLDYVSLKEGGGILEYEFPERLLSVLVAPFRFSRVRTHFLIRLSGKYSVTLYEILEAFTRDGLLEVSISDLRRWLGVEEGSLLEFKAFRRRVLEPAIKQINDSSDQSGFTVELFPVKGGRQVVGLKFFITKTPIRLREEAGLARQRSNFRGVKLRFRGDVYEKAKKVAPRLDIHEMERQFNEWVAKKDEEPRNLEAAFVAFCRKKAQTV